MPSTTIPNLSELAHSNLTVFEGGDHEIPTRELAERIEQALAAPLDYPPLASATVPGDQVTVALDAELPQLAPLVEGTLAGLHKAGVEDADVTFLLRDSSLLSEEDFSQLVRSQRSKAHVVIHQAEEPEQLAMLGVTQAGLPLRLNRALCDADLVITIGLNRPQRGVGPLGGMIFPQFSEPEHIARFHQPLASQATKDRRALQDEAAECNWLLGVGLAVEIVPGEEDGVSAVYCGTPAASAEEAQNFAVQQWALPEETNADLVVAELGLNERGHSWQDFCHGLTMASELVSPGGAIALCAQMAERPGKALARLKDTTNLAAIETKLLKENSADSWAALTLCRALQLGPVYLLSNLAERTVENMGMTPIGNETELRTLISHYPSCVVLKNAQFAHLASD